MKSIEETISCVFERKKNHEIRQIERKKKVRRAMVLSLCFCLLLAGWIGGSALLRQTAYEEYRILLDVNPSIEISVDRDHTVQEVRGLNEDGANTVKEAPSVEGKSVEEALKSLMGEVVDQGYLSQEANSVLVSIEGADQGESETIKKDVAEYVSETLKEKALDGALIVQVLPGGAELSSISGEYGISPGKAQLISQIIEQNKFHSFEELSKLSIHELNLLRVSYFIEMEDTVLKGEPGELAYVGAKTATNFALQDAKVAVADAEVVLECRESVMQYRVEFETAEKEYRYRINAVTGEIISSEVNALGENRFAESETAPATIGENAALNAALKHCGMEKSTLIRVKLQRDWIKGTIVYNVFFTDGISSGRYVMNAATGEVLQYSQTKEYHDRSVKESVIGTETAKKIALSKDGLLDGNLSKYEILLKSVDGGYVYEISYLCNGAKYNVKISARDQTVLHYEKILLKDTGAVSTETSGTPSAEA